MDGILFPVFGGDADWHQTSPKQDRVAVLEHPEFGPLLWTDHPTTLQFGTLRFGGTGLENEVLGFVAGYAAAAARRRPNAV